MVVRLSLKWALGRKKVGELVDVGSLKTSDVFEPPKLSLPA